MATSETTAQLEAIVEAEKVVETLAETPATPPAQTQAAPAATEKPVTETEYSKREVAMAKELTKLRLDAMVNSGSITPNVAKKLSATIVDLALKDTTLATTFLNVLAENRTVELNTKKQPQALNLVAEQNTNALLAAVDKANKK